jgi:hypothetical protein
MVSSAAGNRNVDERCRLTVNDNMRRDLTGRG